MVISDLSINPALSANKSSIEEPMERIAQHLRNMEVQPSIE